ncbi:MAG: hypothetical protein ACFFE8_16440 [Candidatus Heimdallarchaeota archaeon]
MKMSCEATCATCYLPGGRRQEFPDPNAHVWFCRSCRKVFFCEIGLGRAGEAIYSCPHCSVSVEMEEIDKILIAKGRVPAKTTESYDVYQKTMKSLWGNLENSDVSVTISAQVSELCDFKGLTIPLLKNLALNFQVERKILQNMERKSDSACDFLSGLGVHSPELIAFLFSALKRQESLPNALLTRFAIFCAEHKAREFSTIEIAPFSGYSNYDLRLIVRDREEVWVYVLDEDLDLDNLEAFIKRIFQIDFLNHPLVRRVYLVAQSFSYLAKGMLKKHQSAISGAFGYKQTFVLPITLWQPISNKFGFRSVPMEI